MRRGGAGSFLSLLFPDQLVVVVSHLGRVVDCRTDEYNERATDSDHEQAHSHHQLRDLEPHDRQVEAGAKISCRQYGVAQGVIAIQLGVGPAVSDGQLGLVGDGGQIG